MTSSTISTAGTLATLHGSLTSLLGEDSGWDGVEKMLSNPSGAAAARMMRIRHLREEIMKNRLEMEHLEEAERVLAGAGWGNSEPISILSPFRSMAKPTAKTSKPFVKLAKGA